MDIIIYIIAAALVATLLWFVTRKKVEEKPEEQARRVPRARENVPRGGRRRRDVRDRIRRAVENQDQYDDAEETDSDEGPTQKIGAKKQRKLQEKEERRLAREAAEMEREERKLAQQEKDELMKKKEEQRQAQEAKELEEEKKLEEEREKREHEEYLKLKEMFAVEEEGEGVAVEEEESENMLHEFITYIKENKVVLLEDLASHFGLRTQAVIDRVHDLLKDGYLSGVIDDRGKFIYISQDELKAVADFVKQRGRVSITELAKASNTLINLKPEKALTLAK